MALQLPPPPPLPPPAVALIIAAGGIYTHASVDSNTNPKANGNKMSVESLLYMVATIAVAALLLVGVRSVIHWCIESRRRKASVDSGNDGDGSPAVGLTGPIYTVNVFNYGGVGGSDGVGATLRSAERQMAALHSMGGSDASASSRLELLYELIIAGNKLAMVCSWRE